ncbi:MAG: cyclic nucleotide-binding domain-containing protein, partial [Nitrospirae bacterium]
MPATTLPQPETPGVGLRLLRRLMRRSAVARELAALDAGREEVEVALAPPPTSLEDLIYRRKPPRRKGNGRAKWERDPEVPVRFQGALRRWLAADYGRLAVRQYRRIRMLPAAKAEELLESLTLTRVPAGTGLYWLHEPADMVFFVRRGRVALHCDHPLPETPVATVEAGDLFGEMEVILNVSRRTTAVALEESELLCLPAHRFL